MSTATDKHGAVRLDDEAGVTDVLVNSVLGLWEVVNNLTRLRPSKNERYRVTIFGSARAQPGTFAYDETKRLARALTELGCDIVTGGGPGLMRAANEGASETSTKGRQSLGIRVELPFEQGANAFVTQLYEHRTFFTRLHHFVLASDAFVIVPGGIGTALEALMVWQLLQVGHIERVPLVFLGRMWRDLVQWTQAHMLDPRLMLASPEDLTIPRCVENTAEAVALIHSDYERWRRERESRER